MTIKRIIKRLSPWRGTRFLEAMARRQDRLLHKKLDDLEGQYLDLLDRTPLASDYERRRIHGDLYRLRMFRGFVMKGQP